MFSSLWLLEVILELEHSPEAGTPFRLQERGAYIPHLEVRLPKQLAESVRGRWSLFAGPHLPSGRRGC